MSTTARRVLVTGGAGFIGSHLVDRLLDEGVAVTVLDNFDDFYEPAIKHGNLAGAAERGARVVHGDIRDASLVGRLLAKEAPFDTVVHLAARAGVRPSLADPELYFDVNVRGTMVLLQALRERPSTRFVFASSSSVYGGLTTPPFAEEAEASRPVSPYAASKKACEVLCATYHHLYQIPMTGLRFFTVYGPRQRPEMAIAHFCRLLRNGEPLPLFGDGSSARDYTYVDDIVDGVMLSIDRCGPYRIYNLGESETVTLEAMVDTLAAALGVTPTFDRQPDQPGDVPLTCADITRAREELAYRPSVPFAEGVRRYVAWLGAQATA